MSAPGIASSPRTALLVGATGLVGRSCLRILVAEPAYAQVLVLARRQLPGLAEPASHLRTIVTDFERLDDALAGMRADHVFCAFGTTMRKAGSREAFRRVDFDYPVQVARLALERGATHFVLVSAIGADARSRVFYNRVKGEVEDAVRRLGYRSLTIVRPSLLLGPREEFRLGEQVGKLLGVLAPRSLRPVEAKDVAAAMVRAAVDDAPGVRVIESGEIVGLRQGG